jgi:Orsellinic acid/F9775 biosynthesis cluster protein D
MLLDSIYNLTICSVCSIGIPFEWLTTHFKNHGLDITNEKAMECLDIEIQPMDVHEVENWLKETWIIERPIAGIPILQGLSCNICNYSCGSQKAMKNHFSESHKGSKWSNSIKKCKVQRPFNGKFHKFIQLEDETELELELESNQEEDWKTILKEDFKRKVQKEGNSKELEHVDLRLMGAFIAKIRWDLAIKDVDSKRLSQLVTAPTIRDNLHKVLLCGRRYIKQCCEKLNGGNMMVRRKLMCSRYNSNFITEI